MMSSFIFTEENKFKVLRLIHAYHHLNESNLIDLFLTNIIIYKVRLTSEIKLMFYV